MSSSMILILFIIGMVLSIYLGSKAKINIGLIAIVIGYIIAVFGMGLKTSEYIALFPTKIVFTILGICWFFGYANENGTLQKITLTCVYKFRKYPSVLPWIFFFTSGIICMIGASPYAPNAVLMPIIIGICLNTGLSPLFGSLMVNMGSYIGAQVPWGQGASIQRGIIEQSVYAAEAEKIIVGGHWSSVIFALTAGVIIFLVFKGWTAKVPDGLITQPEPMNKNQKMTAGLIILLLVLMLGPSLIGTLGVKTMSVFARKLDIALVCLVLAAISGLLRLANDKAVVTKNIPWNTLMMIAGVSMLVGVATAGGAIDLIGAWIGSSFSTALIVPLFVLMAAFMSVFAPGSSVIVPTMFALIPSVAATSGANYVAMYHGSAIGSNASAVSPFSGGGSLTLANIKQDEVRDKMFVPLIISAGCLSILATIMGALGLFN